jgi:hypothetical protein
MLSETTRVHLITAEHFRDVDIPGVIGESKYFEDNWPQHVHRMRRNERQLALEYKPLDRRRSAEINCT